MSTEGTVRILDASAVLALLQEEPGADVVEAALDDAKMSCVNVSEVLQKAEQHGIDTEGLETDLQALGVRLHAFDVGDARTAADLWHVTRPTGLSLGDRACLALARRVGGVAVTADAWWAELEGIDIPVQVVR
ncbi:MAG: type II toxin-antitoxin system VapC family toxin [Actinomycetota bacterium]